MSTLRRAEHRCPSVLQTAVGIRARFKQHPHHLPVPADRSNLKRCVAVWVDLLKVFPGLHQHLDHGEMALFGGDEHGSEAVIGYHRRVGSAIEQKLDDAPTSFPGSHAQGCAAFGVATVDLTDRSLRKQGHGACGTTHEGCGVEIVPRASKTFLLGT